VTFLVIKRTVHFVQKFRKFPLLFRVFLGEVIYFFTEIYCLRLFIFTDVTFGQNLYNVAVATLSTRIYFFFCNNDRDICNWIRIAVVNTMVICAQNADLLHFAKLTYCTLRSFCVLSCFVWMGRCLVMFTFVR